MGEETRALEENQTWTIKELSPGTKPVNYKCVYKVKYKTDGTVERFKAHWVV